MGGAEVGMEELVGEAYEGLVLKEGGVGKLCEATMPLVCCGTGRSDGM